MFRGIYVMCSLHNRKYMKCMSSLITSTFQVKELQMLLGCLRVGQDCKTDYSYFELQDNCLVKELVKQKVKLLNSYPELFCYNFCRQENQNSSAISTNTVS